MQRKLGIKQKFVSLALVLLAAVALFILVFFPYRQQQQMSEYLKQKVFVISDMVAYSTTSGLLFDDMAAVKTYLDILKSLDEVQFALVFKDGNAFADYRRENSKLYQETVNTLLPSKDRTSVELENITIAAVPVMSDNDVVGRVIVGVTRENLKRDVMQSRIVAIVVGIAVLAVGGLVFVWQTTRIVEPLLSLERASRKVAEGDMDVEVTTTSTDEVGVLANVFNVMVANVRSSIEEIRNKNTALIMQQEIIEQFNKRITDSIQYGKRIQAAILPDPTVMSGVLPKHFVVFKPKDVVSGDFYWFTAIEGKAIVAVVDCTGHGVPGAFMSMIGNTLLNQIVNQKRIFDPASILTELNIGVRSALKQDSDNMLAKDGMDVCLSVIDGNTISFAGANLSLYVARPDKEVERIKGNSAFIGGRQKEGQKFVTQTVPIEPRMAVYMTSDGYPDQSNEQGMKFSTRKFQRLIQETYMMDVAEQRKHFVKAMSEHQGNEDQRDDITVIGIQF
jgi:serine phosphatase RsbU (regulator of sigma subunit)